MARRDWFYEHVSGAFYVGASYSTHLSEQAFPVLPSSEATAGAGVLCSVSKGRWRVSWNFLSKTTSSLRWCMLATLAWRQQKYNFSSGTSPQLGRLVNSESVLRECVVLEAGVPRRLWWSLILCKNRISEIANFKDSTSDPTRDHKIPLNVQLWPPAGNEQAIKKNPPKLRPTLH